MRAGHFRVIDATSFDGSEQGLSALELEELKDSAQRIFDTNNVFLRNQQVWNNLLKDHRAQLNLLTPCLAIASTGPNTQPNFDNDNTHTTDYLAKLIKFAERVAPEFTRRLNSVGGKNASCNLKSRQRILEKTRLKYNHDYSKCLDILRGQIICENFKDLYSTVQRFKDEFKDDICRCKDRLTEACTDAKLRGNYRDILFNVKLRNQSKWMLVEVQIHLAAFYQIKDQQGHSSYTEARDILERVSQAQITMERAAAQHPRRMAFQPLFDALQAALAHIANPYHLGYIKCRLKQGPLGIETLRDCLFDQPMTALTRKVLDQLCLLSDYDKNHYVKIVTKSLQHDTWLSDKHVAEQREYFDKSPYLVGLLSTSAVFLSPTALVNKLIQDILDWRDRSSMEPSSEAIRKLLLTFFCDRGWYKMTQHDLRPTVEMTKVLEQIKQVRHLSSRPLPENLITNICKEVSVGESFGDRVRKRRANPADDCFAGRRFRLNLVQKSLNLDYNIESSILLGDCLTLKVLDDRDVVLHLAGPDCIVQRIEYYSTCSVPFVQHLQSMDNGTTELLIALKVDDAPLRRGSYFCTKTQGFFTGVSWEFRKVKNTPTADVTMRPSNEPTMFEVTHHSEFSDSVRVQIYRTTELDQRIAVLVYKHHVVSIEESENKSIRIGQACLTDSRRKIKIMEGINDQKMLILEELKDWPDHEVVFDDIIAHRQAEKLLETLPIRMEGLLANLKARYEELQENHSIWELFLPLLFELHYAKFDGKVGSLSVTTLMQLMLETSKHRKTSQGKNLVVFFGNTGAGKSTCVNWLSLLPLHIITNEFNEPAVDFAPDFLSSIVGTHLSIKKYSVLINADPECRLFAYQGTWKVTQDSIIEGVRALRLRRTIDLNQATELKMKDQELELQIGQIDDAIAEILLDGSVLEPDECGCVRALPPSAKIGHSVGRSETIYARAYSLDTSHLVLLDCPGFEDTRGPEYDLCTNVSRDHAIQVADSIEALTCVVPYSVFVDDRGNKLIDICSKISERFKDIMSSDSLCFVVTKVPVGITEHSLHDKIDELALQASQVAVGSDVKSMPRYRDTVWKALVRLADCQRVILMDPSNTDQAKELMKSFQEFKSSIPKSTYQTALEGRSQQGFEDLIQHLTHSWTKLLLPQYEKLTMDILGAQSSIIAVRKERQDLAVDYDAACEALTSIEQRIAQLQTWIQIGDFSKWTDADIATRIDATNKDITKKTKVLMSKQSALVQGKKAVAAEQQARDDTFKHIKTLEDEILVKSTGNDCISIFKLKLASKFYVHDVTQAVKQNFDENLRLLKADPLERAEVAGRQEIDTATWKGTLIYQPLISKDFVIAEVLKGQDASIVMDPELTTILARLDHSNPSFRTPEITMTNIKVTHCHLGVAIDGKQKLVIRFEATFPGGGVIPQLVINMRMPRVDRFVQDIRDMTEEVKMKNFHLAAQDVSLGKAQQNVGAKEAQVQAQKQKIAIHEARLAELHQQLKSAKELRADAELKSAMGERMEQQHIISSFRAADEKYANEEKEHAVTALGHLMELTRLAAIIENKEASSAEAKELASLICITPALPRSPEDVVASNLAQVLRDFLYEYDHNVQPLHDHVARVLGVCRTCSGYPSMADSKFIDRILDFIAECGPPFIHIKSELSHN